MTLTTPAIHTDGMTFPFGGREYEARFEVIDPITAQQMLGQNTSNRRYEPKLADFYGEEMTAGRWIFDGAPIRFSDEGILIDGQHRLGGVVASGTTQPFIVIYGLPKDSQDVMDGGRRRSAADMLALYNETNSMVLAALARHVIAWRSGEIRTSTSIPLRKVSNVEIRELVDSDPLLRWAVSLSTQLKKSIPATPTAIAFAAWMLGQEDEVLTEAYFASMAEMRTNGPGDPRYAAITRIQKIRKNTGSFRSTVPVATQAFVFIRGWDAWRKGETLTQIHVQRGDKSLKFPRLPDVLPDDVDESVEA